LIVKDNTLKIWSNSKNKYKYKQIKHVVRIKV